MEQVLRDHRARGLALLAVNIEEDRETVARWARAKTVTSPLLLDPTGSVNRAYRATQRGGAPGPASPRPPPSPCIRGPHWAARAPHQPPPFLRGLRAQPGKGARRGPAGDTRAQGGAPRAPDRRGGRHHRARPRWD